MNTLSKYEVEIDKLKRIALKLDRACRNGEIDEVFSEKAQDYLTSVADGIIDSKSASSEAYIVYEVQSLLHWVRGEEADSRELAKSARIVKGDSELFTETGRKLVSVRPAKTTKAKRSDTLVGIQGWLGWYVVGLFIGTGITIFNFFYGGVGMASSDVYSLNEYQAGLGDTFRTLTIFENIAMIIYIALLVSAIVLILRKKKIAKPVVITCMVFGAAYMLADYAIASSLFNSSNLTQFVQAELSTAAGYASRSVLGVIVWVPYFLVSKRVKATLTVE